MYFKDGLVVDRVGYDGRRSCGKNCIRGKIITDLVDERCNGMLYEDEIEVQVLRYCEYLRSN